MKQSNFINKWFPAVTASPARKTLAHFIVFAVQLLVLFAVMYRYGIEARQGLPVLLLPIGAVLLINYWLPERFAGAMMLATTLGLLLFIFGPISGSVFIVLVLIFLGVAHLKINYALRIGIILLLTLGLIALRLQWIYMPRVLVVLPWVGSMLMFRFILYLYELKHEKVDSGITIWQRLSYIFIPVNLAMPLFPIIDFKTFIRSQTEGRTSAQDQLAFRRILLGIGCFLLYRYLYHFVPNAATLHSTREVLLYLLLSYTLILRMLGLFWIAIGIVGLYGFQLPPVFDQAFFITGFGEIWRKINIYWRSFVTKVFYYPLFFRLRKKTKYAVLLSSLIVFLITWQLHNWQWFWIQGHFQFKLTDLLYWFILGTCISINLSQQANDEQATVVDTKTWRASLVIALRAIGMFLFMSFLWSLWNSASIHEWVYLLSRITQEPPATNEWMLWIGSVLAFLLLFATLLFLKTRFEKQIKALKPETLFATSLQTVVPALLLLALCWLPLQTHLPAKINATFALVSSSNLNQLDKEDFEQGYYEQLVGQSGNGSPWELTVIRDPGVAGSEQIIIHTANLLQRSYKPNCDVLIDNRYRVQTNAWGMRDQMYAKEKAKGTFRVALLGGSYEMGVGVNNNEVYEAIIEARLNAELKKQNDTAIQKIEILNFAGGGYHVAQHLWLCDHKIFDFQPDLILYIAHSEDARRFNGFFANLIQNGIPLEYAYYDEVKEKADVKQWMSRNEIRNRLLPFNDSLMRWSIEQMSERCINHQAAFQLAYLPALADAQHPQEPIFWKSFLTELHAQTPTAQQPLIHETVFSLEHIWDNVKRLDYQVSETNSHPNKLGHQRIADSLYPMLEKLILQK